jgi:hypothetical protein
LRVNVVDACRRERYLNAVRGPGSRIDALFTRGLTNAIARLVTTKTSEKALGLYRRWRLQRPLAFGVSLHQRVTL